MSDAPLQEYCIDGIHVAARSHTQAVMAAEQLRDLALEAPPAHPLLAPVTMPAHELLSAAALLGAFAGMADRSPGIVAAALARGARQRRASLIGALQRAGVDAGWV